MSKQHYIVYPKNASGRAFHIFGTNTKIEYGFFYIYLALSPSELDTEYPELIFGMWLDDIDKVMTYDIKDGKEVEEVVYQAEPEKVEVV